MFKTRILSILALMIGLLSLISTTANAATVYKSGKVKITDVYVGDTIFKDCQLYKNSGKALEIYDTNGTTLLHSYESNGYIKDVQPGYHTVVIQRGEGAGATVKIRKLAPEKVSLDESTLSLTVGGVTATLTATVTPNYDALKGITWSSSDTSVATVNNGVVTPVAAGTTVITATSSLDNTKTATCTVTVSYPTYNLTANEETGNLSGLNDYKGKTCTVTYARSFTADKPSTVCLPFAYTKKTGDGSFYEFTGIEKVGSEYIATMTEPGTSTLTANRPYLYKAATTGDADFSGTYAIPASIEAGTTTSGDWTFKGTYSTIEWTDAPAEHTYGFSAQDANAGITQGQFVKVGSYVRIKPMRAYLQYNGSDSQFINARSLTRAAATTSDDTLPETIGVRLISANGEVNAIGTLYTRTGEVSFDSEAWYTLDGKRLNAKPTQKGIYVNNGKKVVIK